MAQISAWREGFLRGATFRQLHNEGKHYPQHETPIQQTNLKITLEVGTKSKW